MRSIFISASPHLKFRYRVPIFFATFFSFLYFLLCLWRAVPGETEQIKPEGRIWDTQQEQILSYKSDSKRQTKIQYTSIYWDLRSFLKSFLKAWLFSVTYCSPGCNQDAERHSTAILRQNFQDKIYLKLGKGWGLVLFWVWRVFFLFRINFDIVFSFHIN